MSVRRQIQGDLCSGAVFKGTTEAVCDSRHRSGMSSYILANVLKWFLWDLAFSMAVKPSSSPAQDSVCEFC